MNTKIASKFAYRNDPENRFVLTRPFEININLGKKDHYYKHRGRTWVEYNDGSMRIREGYAWNGASPTFKVLGKWFGPPCPDSMKISSLVHDAMWQFAALKECVWDFKKSNDVFYEVMSITRFPLRDIYHGAVDNIGPIYRKFCDIRDISCLDLTRGVESFEIRQ